MSAYEICMLTLTAVAMVLRLVDRNHKKLSKNYNLAK